MTLYYDDGACVIYLGDARELLPSIDTSAVSVVIADPPYAETSLAWDRWPDGWVQSVEAAVPAASLWCFGSMRMFLDRRDDFAAWSFAQEVIWEKHNGSGFNTDRFKRVHEITTHWYRGRWEDQHQNVPRVRRTGPDKSGRRSAAPPHRNPIGQGRYDDDGFRIARSVQFVASPRDGLHPTQKPLGIITPLLTYSCPPGGLVLDPMCGSGSTLRAAKDGGWRAIGIEIDERYCEIAAKRLAQEVLAL